jgi:hypothetical protein
MVPRMIGSTSISMGGRCAKVDFGCGFAFSMLLQLEDATIMSIVRSFRMSMKE